MGWKRTCPQCDAEVGNDDRLCGQREERLSITPVRAHKIAPAWLIGIPGRVVVGCVILGVVAALLAGGCLSLSPQPSLTPLPPTPNAMRPTITPRSMIEADPYEPDDTIAEAKPITVDGTVQVHNLHVESDRDYLFFESQERIAYTIETLNLGSDIDTIIYLYDSQENELARDDDSAEQPLASRILWIAPSAETFYAMVRDLGDNSAGAEATYSIRVTAGGEIEGDQYEPDDTIAEAKPIDTDGTRQAHSFHTSTDMDYISFIAQQGVEYTIETGNLQGGCDTIIYLYDEGGEELDYDDDGGEVYASRIVWKASSSGTYYIRIEEFIGQAGPEVRYDIWISRPQNAH